MTFGVKDLITISVAAVGAVLGIINTWSGLNQKRLRLRVVPKMCYPAANGMFGTAMGCIEVINLSAFPVSVQEIGFTLPREPGEHEPKKMTIIVPMTLDGQPFLRRLEPRQSASGYFTLDNMASNIQKAYVVTECGERAYGISPALDVIRRSGR